MSERDARAMWSARCAIAICVAGAAWRLLFYLYDKNLWLDEAMLSLSISSRNFAGLCQPLEMWQMAPLGFLWLTKACVIVLGDHDLAYRLPDLLAGWLAILVFYKLVKETMPGGGAGALFALALFALNGALIRYVCEVKPYEIDALVSALLLLTGACLLRRWRTGDLLCFMAAAMIAPWFSYTSCFVSGAVGTTAALQYFSARQPKRALLIAAATGVAALSFLINYYYFCKSPSSAMMAMHRDEWLRLPPRNLSDIRLDGSLLLESLVSPGGFDLPVIGLLLLGLGAAAFFMERNSLGALLGCTVLLGIIGSQAAKYPWTGRLLLFLVPVMCLAAGFGMQFIGQSMERRRFQMTAALICVLTLLPLGYTQFRRTVRPFLHQGAQTAMDLISARAPAGSQVFIDDYSTPVFRFYDRHGEFSARFHVIGSGLFMQDEEVYRQQLLALKGKGKVWVFFPDYYIGGTDHPASVLATLDTIGHREDAIDLFTSKAYLYTF